jgi:hypothetical protein
MRWWWLKPISAGWVSTERAANRICSRRCRVPPLLVQRPARALDSVDGGAGEISPLDLLHEAVWGVEVGGGEELRPAGRVGVAVLPVRQVLVHDRPEDRIIQPALIQPIQQRSEPADRHRQQLAARPQHPPGLGQRLPSLRGVGQVVQRAEQQHRVLRAVGFRQLPRVPRRGGEGSRRVTPCCLAGLLHVQRHRIHQVHPVPAPGQRRGIATRSAANIQQPGRRRRQQPLGQLHRPDELQGRPSAGEQPGTLVASAVMAFDRRINHGLQGCRAYPFYGHRNSASRQRRPTLS